MRLVHWSPAARRVYRDVLAAALMFVVFLIAWTAGAL